MKKLFNYLLVGMMLFVTACGAKTEEKEPEPAVEEETVELLVDDSVEHTFLEAFAKAMEARWNVEVPAFEYGSLEHKEAYEALVNAEREYITEDFREADFTDPELKELANAYLDALAGQEEALSYLPDDVDTYEEQWDIAYKARSKSITAINNSYELNIDPQYSFMLNSLANVAYADEHEDEVWDMLNMGELKAESSLTGGSIIDYEIKNTVDHTFKDWDVYFYMIMGNDLLDLLEARIDTLAPGETTVLHFESDVPEEAWNTFFLSWE